MSETEDTPTTEELAKELAATEGSESTETAPDSAPDETPEPDAPADTDGTDPPPDETEAPPDGTDPPPDKTIAPPVKALAPDTSQADKKKADTTRRTKVIADSETPDLPVDEDDEKRKAEIYDELDEVHEEQEHAQAAVEACKGRTRELVAKLYPHTVQSDRLVDAVRGHIAAQKKIRKNRASNPARIAEILKAAGRAPIDNAFQIQRARGMTRPTRNPAKPAADDQGSGSSANAGSE